MRSRYRGPDAGILYALAVMIPLWLLAALTYWCVSR